MQKPKVSLDSIYQEISLDEFTDVDLSDYRGIREAIGQAILDKINARTASGIGYGSTKLKSPYSKPYQKSLNFKAAGKSASNINMRLTGDMLETMEVDTGKDDATIMISIAKDQTPKAFNHLTGDTVPKRNFFGVTKKEMSGIVEEFSDDIEAARVKDDSVSDENDRRAAIREALDELNDKEDDE